MTTRALSTHQTACPLDCPDTCSLEVHVEDGRLLKLEGTERNPVTSGFICSKVRHFDRHLYGEDRLLTPMRRSGAKGEALFEPISWSTALDEVAAGLRRAADAFGGESILPFAYGGSNGAMTQDTLDARLFRRLGASRLARTVCAAATGAALHGLYGKMPGVSYEDYAEAGLIVVWGANPSASGIHLVPYIRRAQKKGAKLVVIDPRRTPLAKKADLHLAPRPGTDLPLALSVIRWLFENDHADLDFLDAKSTGADRLRERAQAWSISEAAATCDVKAHDIESFARLYAQSSPAVIRCGWGQERNRNGGSATAAILALPAVAGKFGVRGGGYTASNSGSFALDTEPVINEPEVPTRRLNMNRLGRQLLEATPAIKALFIYNANPVGTLPRQDLVRRGLEREDLFTVVFDQVMTDSARYADILLPATTFLEHRDLRVAYGAFAMQRIQPAIGAVGESRPNPDVFEALLERLDLTRTGDVCAADLYASLLEAEGLDDGQRQALVEEGICEPGFGRRPIQLVDIHPGTVDGRIHLFPEDLDAQAAEGLYVFRRDATRATRPLVLLSPATNKTICSTLGQVRQDEVMLDIHPLDAAPRGVRSGDEIRAWNEFGEVRCRARVTEDLRPGIASLAKGMWCRQSTSDATGNVFVPDSYTDIGDGACFNEARVDIEKA